MRIFYARFLRILYVIYASTHIRTYAF